MNKDIYLESLQSVYEYIPKLRNGIDRYINLYNSNNITQDMVKLLQMILEGFNWLINVIDKCKHIFQKHGMEFDEDEINTIMKELLESIENDDENLILEILENEILDILDRWNRNIEKIVS